jgi:hypothetical protein
VSADPIVDAEVVGTEIVPQGATATPQTIFRTDDPMEIMQRTAEVATALKQFVKDQGLLSQISGRDYIVVEGWQMAGMMLGVTPGKVTTLPVEHGWEAIVELHDRTGRIVGSGEAECLDTEKAWKSHEDYARKSMAQTRAVGKAFRNTFGFIAKAAGMEATPAEEMPPEQPAAQGPPYGPETDDKILAQTRRAIAFLLSIESGDEQVTEVLRAIAKEADGYLPVVASAAICRIAKTVRDGTPAAVSGEPVAPFAESTSASVDEFADAFTKPLGGTDEVG